MGYYIDQNGDYYEGDRQGTDNEVPQRPSANHTWAGEVWILGRPPIPSVVTMRQALTALSRFGLLDAYKAAVAVADEETRIACEFSTEVRRDFPLVQTLAAALNLSEQQLDDIFTLAATL